MSDDFALRVARAASPHVDPSDVAAAIEAIELLGYTFVASGSPGRTLASDDAHRGLADYLRNEIGVSFSHAHKTIAAIHSLGFALLEPATHPSGLKTQEAAFTKIAPFGARHAAGMKTIERSGFDGNGVEIPNR